MYLNKMLDLKHDYEWHVNNGLLGPLYRANYWRKGKVNDMYMSTYFCHFIPFLYLTSI